MIPKFGFISQDMPHDYRGQMTVTWAELEDCGFIDWDDPAWTWDYYDEEQRERLQKKIADRYEYREIGILPWAAWRRQFIRKLNEIMPKYKILYKKLADPSTNFFLTANDYGKERHVFSDFPATLLDTDNQDYASNATDRQYEDMHEGDTLEKLNAIRKSWDDVDVMILDELEPLFSSFMSASVNAF